MPEDFNMREHQDDWAYWLIIKAITKSGKINEVTADRTPGLLREHQVEFKVNGVELPFVESVADIKGYLDELVLKKALELIEKTLRDKLYKVEELFDDVEDKARELLEIPKEED